MIDYHNWKFFNIGGVDLAVGYKPTGYNDKGETTYSCVCRECTHKLLSMHTSLEALERCEVPCNCIVQSLPVELTTC